MNRSQTPVQFWPVLALTLGLMSPSARPQTATESKALHDPEPGHIESTSSVDTGSTDSTNPRVQSEREADTDGLWPSRKLLRLMLTRFVDEACDRYDMNEDQREQVRDAMIDKWDAYLTERRSDFSPLLNEFLEMRMGLEPPDAAVVQEWAKRAAPAFDDVRDQVEESWDSVREVLTPWQRARFEVESIAARAGMEMASSKLTRWREGSFELNDVWEPRDRESQKQAREDRRRRRAEQRAVIEAEAEGASGDQVDQELDRWQAFVAEFIAAHQLDEGQRSTALSLLAELRGRAIAHRDRHRDEIAELERRIERPKEEGVDDRDAIKAELVKLYGPIDELFAELERRLDVIPTEAQRAAATVKNGSDEKSFAPVDRRKAVSPMERQEGSEPISRSAEEE